ncbi:MAG: TrkA family potassium uptake protein [Spirochaetales bacterium]|nr:TrkA family potassium uptake protein [Spirochaetales bacterium]
MNQTIAVIGLGAFGRQVCETLSEKGATVIAIDKNPLLIERMKNTVNKAVLLDSTEQDALQKVSFEDVQTAIVGMGDDIEASILTTALLKELAVPTVIARAVSDLHGKVLKQVGADIVLNLEIEEGRRLAQQLIAPDALDRITLSASISLAEIILPESFSGFSVEKLDLRKKYRLNIAAIKRDAVRIDEIGNPRKEEYIITPEPGIELKEGDILMVVGKNDDINTFLEEQGTK